MGAVTQPGDTVQVACMECRRTLRVPAGRRLRAIRLGHAFADFCSRKCNQLFVSKHGKQAQLKLNDHPPSHRSIDAQATPPSP
jgi:hypothetical protein